ncbi:MAG TPA: hypothetical protein VJS88_02805, partial [Chthoniobacterales bacterium]|nr:hypothetical protein [Chthoniobacterales bacterium]
MQRAAGIFVAGLVLGVLAAAVFMRGARNEGSGNSRTSMVSKSDQAATTSSAQQSNPERDKVVLGNITTVPFQELYSVLSIRSPAEMTELARQLDDLPPGRDARGKVNAFFTAWAHLDAKAALAAAISLKTQDAKGLAVTAVIRGADAIEAKSLSATLSQLPADALPAWQKTRALN